MSAVATPISPARFAEALRDLSLSSLHLKVLELRTSIAQLDYSNEELRPYALGEATPISTTDSSTDQQQQQQPDPDCVEAIRENEEVIVRMQGRIGLVRAEVQRRGISWTEFQSKEEADADAARASVVNGVNGSGHHDNDASASAPAAADEAAPEQHAAWRDGTFQTGVIRGGQVVSGAGNSVSGSGSGSGPGHNGGSLSDEELRRRIEAQLRLSTNGVNGDDHEDNEEDGGLHL
ncbi:hypothetical protein B0T24DRAFT_641255 [Lasiosphaeria ovina]|uniref:Secondary alcohol dehydrogenase n=1 Tax=Lasiosphaeria ovina TaxID=92902 RepID=A0AAE0MZJ7_9PEZI|nr:hypothetical protein B0T24DRAFT_641255 [Lasiosphaeria ovina]